MSFRCVVIDDEKPARDRLKRLLAGHDDFEVVGEATNAAEAVELIDRVEPDLCFLDVQMPEGDGFKVLREVRRVPNVIFTTAYDEYAVRAFEVNSLDYLLKPFGKQRFAEALERARHALGHTPPSPRRILELLERIGRQVAPEGAPEATPASEAAKAPPARISARRGSRILLLDPADVLWFEAEETLVFARTAQGRFLVEKTLAELEQLLGVRFFRAHRGCLVNVSRIVEIRPMEAGTYRVVLGDDEASSVPLSRRQARKLRELFPW